MAIRRSLNKFIRDFVDTIPSDELFNSYVEFANVKSAAAKDIRNKNSWSSSVIELKNFYQSSRYKTLILRLSRFQAEFHRLERLGKVLEKAQKKKKIDPDLKQAALFIIRFTHEFSKLNKRTLSSKSRLMDLLDKQKDALLNNRTRKFLQLMKKEKRLLFPSHSLFKELEEGSGSKNKLSRPIARILLLLLIGSFPFKIYLDNVNPFFFQQVKASAIDFLERSETEEYFEEKYGIDLLGDYTQKDVEKLDSVLNSYTKKLSQISLKKIYILKIEEAPRDAQVSGHGNSAYAISLLSGNINKLFIDHEFAHLWHQNILQRHINFNQLWNSSYDISHGYNKERYKILTQNNKSIYASFPRESYLPRLGYVYAYGGINIREDIATFVEVIKNRPSTFLNVNSYHGTYQKKINMLLNFNFITHEEYNTSMNYLLRAQ